MDISADALDIASANAARNGVANRAEWRNGSWFGPIPGDERFDLVVSNPPYIASDVISGLQVEVRDHDPRRSLDGGVDGLDAYRQILTSAGSHLTRGGMLLFEIGYDQGEAVRDMFENAGFGHCRIVPDLSGLDRAIIAHKPG